MKINIFLFICFILISSFSFAQTIEINGKEYSWDELEHKHPGCPANSNCSRPMGEKILKFKNFLQKLAKDKSFVSRLENYRKKNGLPIKFLMQGEQKNLDPVVWDSHCRIHRQAKKEDSVVVAMQFFHNNPHTDLIELNPVWSADKFYQIPFQEEPLLIKNDEIVVATDFNDVFYFLSINTKGKWKVVDIRPEEVDQALKIREDSSCPEKSQAVLKAPFYAKNYCKKIWNTTLKKSQIITLSWSCP